MCKYVERERATLGSEHEAGKQQRAMTDYMTNLRVKLPATCIILEVIIIILFATLVEYDHDTDAKHWHEEMSKHNKTDYENEFYFRYPSE
ncbi:hypothetical protein JZ751_009840 [Albula glossodonta]|uniref:Uncharacterized protein n=1 Tax=Albula glossodonta TaxID=121402 RepID=A0A8T2NYS7_9TELE|nr:hypothetical protein JZ751_009840 [Albula glossodonta]